MLCLITMPMVFGQNTDKQNKTKEENINLLDVQADLFTDLFGDDLNGNHTGEVNGYLDLIEKMDASEEQKQDLREQYKIYSLSLDPTKKDSLKLLFNKRLQEAMDEPIKE